MTHPPTEALRKQCYERATALLRSERLNRSTRPTEGRESSDRDPSFRWVRQPASKRYNWDEKLNGWK